MRHTDSRQHRFTISEPTRDDPTLVACPRCGERAFVLPAPQAQHAHAVKLVCHACGLTRAAGGQVRCYDWGAENPTDGYFGAALWLQTRCLGHGLWAFNLRHLTLLEGYVAASLRERERDEQWGWMNASLASRLPTWMTAGSNRKAVLRGLATLREKASPHR